MSENITIPAKDIINLITNVDSMREKVDYIFSELKEYREKVTETSFKVREITNKIGDHEAAIKHATKSRHEIYSKIIHEDVAANLISGYEELMSWKKKIEGNKEYKENKKQELKDSLISVKLIVSLIGIFLVGLSVVGLDIVYHTPSPNQKTHITKRK